MEDEDSSSTALGAASVLPLLSLPAPALTCVVDELLHGSKGAALHGLRGACSHLRSAANNRTRHVCIPLDDGLDAALGCISERFPTASKVDFTPVLNATDYHTRLAEGLAALPDNGWPAVEVVLIKDFCIPVPVAMHVVRLCPRLRHMRLRCNDDTDAGVGAAAVLDDLAAVAGTLEVLEINCPAPGGEAHVGAALARLTGLRRLQIDWDLAWPPDAEGLLAAALPALTSLSSLAVTSLDHEFEEDDSEEEDVDLLPHPGWQAPGSLRELGLTSYDSHWALGLLRSAPVLAGVTKLKLWG